MKKALLAITLGVTLGTAALLAHHGGNLYDTSKATELKGTITKCERGTPRTQLSSAATLPGGEVQHWAVPPEPAGVTPERGWPRRSLAAGDAVTAYVFAARNGATVG